MICPNCKSEYREGFTRCSDCDVDLVASVPEEPAKPNLPLVKVYESGNAALIPVVESLLADADIEFMTKGEPIQDLFGWGRFGSNLNFAIGPVEFYVSENDADNARSMLAGLGQPAPPGDETEDG